MTTMTMKWSKDDNDDDDGDEGGGAKDNDDDDDDDDNDDDDNGDGDDNDDNDDDDRKHRRHRRQYHLGCQEVEVWTANFLSFWSMVQREEKRANFVTFWPTVQCGDDLGHAVKTRLVGDGGGWVVMVVISSAKTFPCLRVVFLSETSIICFKMSL